MDVTRQIQIAVVRADMWLCDAFPILLVTACSVMGAWLTYRILTWYDRRRSH